MRIAIEFTRYLIKSIVIIHSLRNFIEEYDLLYKGTRDGIVGKYWSKCN